MNGFDFSIQRRQYHGVCMWCGWERADTDYERWWRDVEAHRCSGEPLPAVTVENAASSPLEAP